MTPRAPEVPVEHNPDPDPSDEGALNSTRTNFLDRTLAAPFRPIIDDRMTLGEADTLDVHLADSSTVTPSLPTHPSGGLRDPILNSRYRHNYQTEGSCGQELGRGGIGRVVLVFDRTLGRNVAMKELLTELVPSDQSQDSSDSYSHAQRFLREARITGQLEHPNIVPVYELGREPSGRLYYTMRVIKGRTLTSAISDASTLAQRLALVNHFAGLCHAIAYAHSRGVVHRDIKPDNVMIGEFGETCVLDWGLANVIEETSPRSLHSAATLSLPPSRSKRPRALAPGTATDFHTQLGTIAGTPQYMSPEQLLCPTESCSPRSDVWALGVVLYYILTGKHPYCADTLSELVLRIASAQLVPISELAPLVPKDLAAIAQRALVRDPQARYQNAADLARDITAYQAGEKVNAYEYSSLDLLRRFAHRNRAPLVVAVGAVASLLCLAAGSYFRIAAARDAAVAAEQRATHGEQRAKLNLSDVLVERARAELSQGDAASATLLAAGALELSERPDARGIVIALSNSERLERQPLPPFVNDCRQATWNPPLLQLACTNAKSLAIHDLRTPRTEPIATLAPHAATFSLNASGWLLPRTPESLQILGADHQLAEWSARLGHPNLFVSASSGKHFAVADSAGTLALFTLNSLHPPKTLRNAYPITAVAFHPAAPLLAFGDFRGQIQLWRWQDQSVATLLGSAHSTVRAMTFGPKGNHLATGSSDGSLLIWDMLQRIVLLAPARATGPIVDLSFSPNGAKLAVATRPGIVEVLDARTYERTLRFAVGTATIQQLTFASNASLVGLADGTTPFHLLLRQAQPSARYASRSNVLSLTRAANQRDILVAGLGERGICHLNLADGSCGDKLPVRVSLVRKVAYSAARKLYVVGGIGGRIELWDAENKLPRGFLDVPIPEVRDLQFLPGGNSLVVVGNAPSLVFVDVVAMRVIDQQPLPSLGQSLFLLPERQLLAIGLRNGHLLLRSLVSGKIEADTRLVSGWPVGIAASERDRWLAVAEDSGKLSFFDLDTQHPLESFAVGVGRVTAFAYSEKQQLIATAGEGRDVHVVSTTVPRSILVRMDEHQSTIRALLFDDTNHRLLSADDDGLVRLWELGSLRLPATQLRQDSERSYGLYLKSGRIERLAR